MPRFLVLGCCLALCAAATRAPAALQPRAFQPLPVGAIRPAGWLQNQLLTQADGLSGHMGLFWRDIVDSVWLVRTPNVRI